MSAVWRIGWQSGRAGLPGLIAIEHWADWAALDAQIAGGNVTHRPDSIFAHHVGGVAPNIPDGQLTELQWVRVNNGAGKLAADLLTGWHLPILLRAGAQQVALFDAVHGDDLPRFAILATWSDAVAALKATPALEADPGLQAKLAALRAEGHRPAILETKRILGFAGHAA